MTTQTSPETDLEAGTEAGRNLTGLIAAVTDLRADVLASARRNAVEIAQVHPAHRADAENLAHYLELRRHDLRASQASLTDLGLSSLGRSEGHVLATIDAVLAALRALAGGQPWRCDRGEPPATPARELLASNSEALFGPPRAGRETRIMVTLPGMAADDYPMVRSLVERGMDCARINCAHDEPPTWSRMITNVRRAAQEVGRPCLVAMDLAGPKARTGPIADGPRVARLRPSRDALGRVTRPAAAWMVDEDEPAPPDPAVAHGVTPAPGGLDVLTVPVPGSFLAALREGDRVSLRDARAARRRLRVTRVAPAGARVETDETTYLTPGTSLRVERGGTERGERARVGKLPALEQFLTLREGDGLTLTRDLAPADPAADEAPRIGCTLPEVFGHVRVGHRVWFDDGKIGGIVTGVSPDDVRLRVTDARSAGARLRAGKSINLPDSVLPIPAMTAKDERDLAFVAAHADIVAMSFVQRRRDVARLQALLAAAGRDDIGVILKIETLRAFEHLPLLLMTAMRGRRIGVMIARGDLAVECGYQRLAELQEEILWLCEAARVPVIWATQVLDQLARTGRPTRAEITDAAVSGRAECVMLNKGPYIADAVALLDDVLTRMGDHQRKKAALMRRLTSWPTAL
jgi:pyruvate kinase